jgi:glycogen operon protein
MKITAQILGRNEEDMTALVSELSELRRRFPQLRAQRWVEGRRADGSFGVLWLTPQATEMVERDWNFPEGRFVSYVLGPVGQADAPLFFVLNAALATIEFTLPILPQYSRWTTLLETAPEPRLGAELVAGSKLQARPRSILVFSGSP